MTWITEGIKWFEDKRRKNLVESIRIQTANSELTVLASVVEPESEVNASGIKVRNHMYVFLIVKATIASLDLSRGVRIFRRGQMYEVIIERNTLTDFNDPDNETIALQAQLRPYVINGTS